MDTLQTIQGVGPATADKLQQAGYESHTEIASATAAELKEKIGLPLATAERIIESAKTLLESEPAAESAAEADEEGTTAAIEIVEDASEAISVPIDEAHREAEATTEVDKRQLANQLVKAILQNPDAVRQIAQEVSSELAQILGKKLRKQLAKKALSRKKFRKSLISGLIKELKRM